MMWPPSQLDDMVPVVRELDAGFVREACSSIVLGTVFWVGGTVLSRVTLKVLLRYKGFLYEKPKNVSWS